MILASVNCVYLLSLFIIHHFCHKKYFTLVYLINKMVGGLNKTLTGVYRVVPIYLIVWDYLYRWSVARITNKINSILWKYCNELRTARSVPAKAEGRRRKAARTRVKQNVYWMWNPRLYWGRWQPDTSYPTIARPRGCTMPERPQTSGLRSTRISTITKHNN